MCAVLQVGFKICHTIDHERIGDVVATRFGITEGDDGHLLLLSRDELDGLQILRSEVVEDITYHREGLSGFGPLGDSTAEVEHTIFVAQYGDGDMVFVDTFRHAFFRADGDTLELSLMPVEVLSVCIEILLGDEQRLDRALRGLQGLDRSRSLFVGSDVDAHSEEARNVDGQFAIEDGSCCELSS